MLNKIERLVIYLGVFVVPITFLTVFPDFFGLPKLIMLVATVSILLIVKAIRIFTEKKTELSSGNFDLPLVILGLAYVLSSVLTKNNKMEAFFAPGNTTIVLSSLILYFFVNSLNVTGKNVVKIFLVASGVFASLFSLLSFANIFTKVPSLAIINGGKFNLFGGDLPAIIFSVALLPLGLSLVLSTKDFAKKILLIVASIIILAGTVLSVVNITSGKEGKLQFVDLQTSWTVAFDTLKESPLLGAGSGNYLSAFSRFKPLSYNSKELWQLRFVNASNYYLTVITETGLIGLAGLALLVVPILYIVQRSKFDLSLIREGQLVSLLLLVVALAVFPGTITTIVLFFIILALNAVTKRHEVIFSHSSKVPGLFVAVPVIAAVSVLAFFSARAVSAEATFKKSLDAFSKNDGKLTYDLMRQAIVLNPYVDRYHSAYAQTNIALAQSIGQKKDITEEDKSTVTALIQQAIREGKNSVFLNPTRSSNWELLARIYQSIIPFAQGADQFSIQSYGQAIALDPINPNLRIALGGVYYSLEKYDEAVDVFKLAVAAKPNLANSHYNLSAAYREKGEFDKAIIEMNAVISLTQVDSVDYNLAKEELAALEKKRPAPTAKDDEKQAPQELTAPKEAEPQVINPPLELPQEATPPATTQ